MRAPPIAHLPRHHKAALLTTLSTALHALDNLKAKLKAAFKKKGEKEPAAENKPAESKPTETTTEPTKTEAAAPPAPASTFDNLRCF